MATLYPVTLAAATPQLSMTHAASLGALTSGTAIVAAPAVLTSIADGVELRLAYLITLPLLAALLVLRSAVGDARCSAVARTVVAAADGRLASRCVRTRRDGAGRVGATTCHRLRASGRVPTPHPRPGRQSSLKREGI
ncbi:hypothetical protein L083_6135 [Actinoplanes sp. N902-109]|nr:hypothetical protein L083_6135 [Actinoplanes sp. N902-109]